MADEEYGDEMTRRLHATTNAQVWAREWCKVARELERGLPMSPAVDEGWMIGWFANAMETAITHWAAAHPERKPVQDVDYVVLSREALLMWLGQYMLPREGDCAPVASMIVEWLEANDLGDLYRKVGD